MESNNTLIPGVRVDVIYYVTSPSTGADIILTASGAKDLPSIEAQQKAVDNLLKGLNSLLEVSDFRPMTDDEIADYLKRQEEEEDED